MARGRGDVFDDETTEMSANKRNKDRKRVQLLSTNNKNFTTGGRMIGDSRVDLTISPGIDDDDVRLEKIRDSRHAARQGYYAFLKRF